MKRILALCVVGMTALATAGCREDLTATVYARDINDLKSAQPGTSVPVDVEINIWENGIAKQCEKPEGQKIVEAIGSVFDKAALVGCEKIQGSMNDKMTVRATTKMFVVKDETLSTGENLMHFDLIPDSVNKGSFYLAAKYNPAEFETLKKSLQAINMMAQVNLDQVTLALNFVNDLREPFSMEVNGGAFASGVPLEMGSPGTLQPRDQLNIKFGDVKLRHLIEKNWAVAITFQPVTQ